MKTSRLKNAACTPWDHYGRAASSGKVRFMYVDLHWKMLLLLFFLHFCVWSGCMRGKIDREQEKEKALWHICGYQKTMPGVGLSSTCLESRTCSCSRCQATWPTSPQDPLISASHLTVRGLRSQTWITRSKLHVGSGDFNSGPHTCAGSALSTKKPPQLKLGNLERLICEQGCMYMSC